MRAVIGCVADSTPKYLGQAARLIKSWRWFAGRYADAEFHVCVVDRVPAEALARYEQRGALVHVVAPFSAAHPPSNKLRFLQLAATHDVDRVILLDCDTVVVQEPHALFEGASLIAKMADLATVPMECLAMVFDAFGIGLPAARHPCTVSGESTIPYFNAGVLSFDRAAMHGLVPRWIELNQRLLERLDLLAGYSNFCEQASLSLALAEIGTGYTLLDNAMNFPVHLRDAPVMSAFGQTDPVIIHYHWLVDDAGRLVPSPYPNVNERIAILNRRLDQEDDFRASYTGAQTK